LTPYPGTALSAVAVSSFTIGQLAHAAGVHIETVRYYERRASCSNRCVRPPATGSMRPPTSGGSSSWRGRRASGFTLTEIASLLEGHDSSDTPDSVLLMAQAKVEALDDKRSELDEARGRLARLIRICADPHQRGLSVAPGHSVISSASSSSKRVRLRAPTMR
jgi:MerR family transcriptional regulator, mercuric resistance operon regulatory protein